MPAPSPDIVALARRLYVENVPVAVILAETKLSHGTLYVCLDGAVEPRLPPLPRRRSVLKRRARPPQVSRVSLVNRLWSAAERQAYDIEQRLIAKQQAPDERERDARVLSVLVKTLRELAAFDEQHGETKADANEADDDFPRDIDELRQELARKIEGLRGDAAGGISGEAAETGRPRY